MIHLISHTNRGLYGPQLEALHRERRQQFIVERGWALSERDGGEYDCYDDERAVQLVGFSAGGEIEVACRLRPTSGGGLIPDVFPHLVAPTEAPPDEPGTFECTRYMSAASARGRAGFEARSKLHLAVVEHVRDSGGDRLLGFVDLPLLTHLRRFSGLRIRPVGLPAEYEEGGVTVAFEIGVTEDDLQEARRKLRLPSPQLFTAPAWLPAGMDVLALERSLTVLLHADEQHRRGLSEHLAVLVSGMRLQPDVDALMAELGRAA